MVELLVVIVLGSLVLMAIYETLILQQRGFTAETAVASVQQSMRTASQVLGSELREASATATNSDIAAIGPDSITFRAFRKAGFLCDTINNGANFDVYTAGDAFSAGDSLLIFIDNDPTLRTDDSWQTTYVSSTGSNSKCTAAWGSYTLQKITLPSAALNGVQPGAPVRSFVWETYGVYKDADGNWMLGRHEPGQAPQPMVGPLVPRDSGGVTFTYYDANNNITTDPTQVNRIVITIRARGHAGAAFSNGLYTDTLTTQVFLRNNS